MEEALFWSQLCTGGETTEERLDTLPDRLAAYSANAFKGFGQMVLDRHEAACREDIWALGFLLMGGCSDDVFDGFRNWLLLQGPRVFATVLADPDGFDPCALTETPLVEGLIGAVEQAYVMRAGKDMPRLKLFRRKPVHPDEARFSILLPKVAERMQ